MQFKTRRERDGVLCGLMGKAFSMSHLFVDFPPTATTTLVISDKCSVKSILVWKSS